MGTRTAPSPTIAPATVKHRTPIIAIRNLQKSFKVGRSVVPVLQDINLEIYPQEFVLFLGPSGSGKSTLLNTILGLESPTSGQVRVNNEDLIRKKSNQLAKFRFRTFGIVFQRADWIRSMNVLQNVSLPLALNNVKRKERLDQAMVELHDMEMDDHALYLPTELSGGQQQKVALARALINNPPIVVADEPTGNLDTVSAEKVMRYFKRLNEDKHKTILMVTHNIEYVHYGTRIINVRDGKITEGLTTL